MLIKRKKSLILLILFGLVILIILFNNLQLLQKSSNRSSNNYNYQNLNVVEGMSRKELFNFYQKSLDEKIISARQDLEYSWDKLRSLKKRAPFKPISWWSEKKWVRLILEKKQEKLSLLSLQFQKWRKMFFFQEQKLWKTWKQKNQPIIFACRKKIKQMNREIIELTNKKNKDQQKSSQKKIILDEKIVCEHNEKNFSIDLNDALLDEIDEIDEKIISARQKYNKLKSEIKDFKNKKNHNLSIWLMDFLEKKQEKLNLLKSQFERLEKSLTIRKQKLLNLWEGKHKQNVFIYKKSINRMTKKIIELKKNKSDKIKISPDKTNKNTKMIIGLSVGGGVIGMMFIGIIVALVIKKKKSKK